MKPTDIIAARIGTIITNNVRKIRAYLEMDYPVEWINPRRAALMASFDLGPNWEKLTLAEPLFDREDV